MYNSGCFELSYTFPWIEKVNFISFTLFNLSIFETCNVYSILFLKLLRELCFIIISREVFVPLNFPKNGFSLCFTERVEIMASFSLEINANFHFSTKNSLYFNRILSPLKHIWEYWTKIHLKRQYYYMQSLWKIHWEI